MDNLRFVLIVMFVWLSFELYQAWQKDYGPKPPEQMATTPAPGEVPTAPTASAATTSGDAATASSLTAEGLAEGQRVRVKTDVLNVEIDTKGGDIRVVDLSTYPVNKAEPNIPVRLLTDQKSELFVSQSGFLAENGAAPNHHSDWKAASNNYELDKGQEELRVPLIWSNGNGVTITKTFVFKRGSFLIEMDQQVANQSQQNWKGQQYTQLQRRQPEKKTGSAFSASSADRAYIGGVLYTPEEKYEKISFDDMKDKTLQRASKNGWIAMIQHYFMAAWIPTAGQEDNYYTKALDDDLFVIGAISPAMEIPPGGTGEFKARMWAGPKLQRELENVAPGLELTEDFGKLTFIAKPVFWLIEQFHKLLGNWGWAIVFATIVIKAAFYKLSESSYRSMANMRKLQPKLQQLKERHGDDKQAFNQAMMELYRKEKVNPLGGCLPILVQMPVFIALYWVLSEAVELRQAPFILWIQDLSARDPYFILPLIYGVSMFIQQKLNPQPTDPIQAQVMKWFPVMFSFFFAFFPSGLVLYWVVNNVLSIFQQAFITKQVEGRSTLFAKSG